MIKVQIFLCFTTKRRDREITLPHVNVINNFDKFTHLYIYHETSAESEGNKKYSSSLSERYSILFVRTDVP